eukprot:CAMPEP_0181249844 /NCGR_PEP_ID=MMETSP1096-20121128/45989_1 /TAXON_ID=156174 ORGANISM="Chrysochromulina ericina, Strain CCMP281" /NCGR_SAMPLE_ID=MMETSP1096 /ASSEMBLY_ACC=CAM_ASM_000453 /LENGTH=110 /DNA_ID=CAMNT_0023347245 /DNA_START=1381 /DNA_END=1710 /DNA_ORIENTATION=-
MSCPATAPHCVPKVWTAVRTNLSSSTVHPALLCATDVFLLTRSSDSVQLRSLSSNISETSPKYCVNPVDSRGHARTAGVPSSSTRPSALSRFKGGPRTWNWPAGIGHGVS